ncbi:MAG: cytochrome c-type biogenesis CcmF C-terminal domain-containing protein, partial [Bryobacteraceae bacterium]
AATTYLILDRLDFLKSEAQLESVVSRESSFLFNNLILLASCFAVLWGTLFPVISEAVTGEKISVDAPFYNRVNVPIGLFLLFLTGVGPLIAWRRSSLDSLKRNFLWPTVGGLSLIAILFALGIHHLYALMSFGLCLFVAWSVTTEFYKGASAIQAKDAVSFPRAVIELTHRNTRRYGGYVVHMAIVVMFIGFTGAAFNQRVTAEVPSGGTLAIGHYQLRVMQMLDGENDNYQWGRLVVDVSKDGKPIGVMEPEKRFYKSSQSNSSVVAIRRRLNEDLYINFAGVANAQQTGAERKAVIQAYVNPLVSCIWCGYYVLFFGTMICLIPSKQRLQYPRMQVVGIAEKHATVEK